MAEIGSDVFAYGLAAGLSVTALLATIIVLATDRGPVNALSLFVGFIVVLAPAVIAAALLSDLATGAGGQQVVARLVKLTLGLLLLGAAWRLRPWQGDAPDVAAKMAAMTAKLQGLEPGAALRVGVGFAVLPKRLAITLLAGAAIGASGVSVGQGLALAALYVLTATSLIWITLAAYVLGGERVAAALETGRVWLTANMATAAFVVALVFGLLFTGQAIVELLA